MYARIDEKKQVNYTRDRVESFRKDCVHCDAKLLAADLCTWIEIAERLEVALRGTRAVCVAYKLRTHPGDSNLNKAATADAALDAFSKARGGA